MKINYIIIAGSSGGHILPAISLINNLSNTKKKIVFITNAEGLKFIPLINNQDCIVKVFEQSNKIKIIFSQFTNCSHYFMNNKNVKVIGFGGFLSVMPIFLGRLFNFILKHNLIYIHEQNIIYGLANKINYFFTNYSFISFPRTKLKKKEIYVGNYFKKNIKSNYSQKSGKIKILLIGGSAGSLDLNNKLLDYIKEIPQEDRINFEFKIQIPSSYESIKDKYKKLSSNVYFFSFINDIKFDDYDLIFSRCGSGSMFEILYFTNNVYFLPHLYSRDMHQKYNKEFFIRKLNIKDEIPYYKNLKNNSDFYFNKIINPFSIHKIFSFISK